ncbi:polymer-forming cytoskeletal protein [Pseudidiomarina sediminum]|uniref:Polymer-forming cytoskeletal protein n=1 Tax=Pseudidiomarina sediminum TaxID=431675 RepID=A0A432ZA02_9GAMM|nr:polymer-forming cytoskeletal protein [Pseudidiomarina sediminum]RUO74739.1 polymer-forming cytoskeletal protein [Pseudidiomarina sediminum]
MGLNKSILVALLLVTTIPTTFAATYDFKKNLPPGCTQKGNGPAYCPNGLSLGWGDVIVANKVHTVIVDGNADLANAQIYQGESVRLAITSSGNISASYRARLNADLYAEGTVHFGAEVDLTGNISADHVYLESRSTLTGDINTATLTTNSNVAIDGAVQASGAIQIASYTEISGAVTAASVNADSYTHFASTVTAQGDISLGSEGVINGAVSGDNVILRASSSRINGDLNATGDVIIESGAEVNGNVAAGYLLMKASNARITGDAVASGDIDLEWAARIDGDATAVNIKNNAGSTNSVGGATYCQSSNGSHPYSCNSTPAPPSQCDALGGLAGYGIIGMDDFDYGNNSQINGTDITDPNNTNGNTPTPTGVVEDINMAFPPIDPAVFPSFNGSVDRTNPTNLPPGTYDRINVSGNGGFASTSGGTYYIEEIDFSNQTNTLQLAPGDYFVKDIDMGNDSSITISPTGRVRIYIRDELNGGNNLFFNSGGSVPNLVIYLYDDAEFEIGNFNQGSSSSDLTFNGVLYAPYENNEIEFGNNTNIQGAILTAGELEIGNNTEITYTDAIEDQVNDAFGCTPEVDEVDHYRILHPQQVVSCLAAPVTVVACLDASCSSRFSDPVALEVLSSASASTWQGGSVASSADNNATFNFSGGEGSGGLRYIDGGNTTLTLGNAAPAALNNVQCYDSTGSTATNCAIDFRTAGLIITAADGTSAIPPSFAGEDFPLAVRAVQTNTQTGACEARVSGPQQLELGTECRNPMNCQAGQTFTAGTTPVALNAANSSINYSPISVVFDANGTAVLPAQYSDVGALRLHARLDLAAAANQGQAGIDDPNVTLTGTSLNDFVVKPHTLVIHALDSADQIATATTDNGNDYARAGEAFSLIVQSLNAQGEVTPNFGNEQTSAAVSSQFVGTLYPSAPDASSTAAKFEGATGYYKDPSRAGTMRTDAARWLDVGTIEVAPGLINDSYLGAGDAAVKQPTAVGRFSPDRFALLTSSLTNSCNAFTYMDEPALAVSYDLVAVNTDGNITANYNASYSDTAVIRVVAAHLGSPDTAADKFAQRLLNLPDEQNWDAGSLSLNVTDAGFARHPDGVIDGPYPLLSLGLQVLSERDNRDFAAGDLTLTTVSGPAAPLNDHLALRYGRFVLENTYGPETEDLSVPLSAQYFDGNRFVLNSLDQCSATQVSPLSVIADPAGLSPIAAGTSNSLSNGELPFGSLFWQATGTGNTGEFIYQYDAPAWLEFDWVDETGTAHRDPRATAGFGQYRANPRVLYWKELN